MSVLIFLIVYYVLLCFTLSGVFKKAGESPSKAWIPGLNFIAWAKLIGRPGWWPALLLLPIVNIFILAGMCVDLVRSFGRYSFWDSFWAVVYAPFPFYQIGKEAKYKYIGPTLELEKAYQEKIREAEESKDAYKLKKLEANNPYKKSSGREWAEAIIFAVFAATFIRMFLIEAYVIPSSSMEGSLLVGDFLFVSKAHYGIRTPETVLQLPLVHNTAPLIGTESYLKSPKLKMRRLPALENIDRLDPVVFNYPEGDSVYIVKELNRAFSVYDIRRRPEYVSFIRGKKLRVRPVDKRDHYIKRCIGTPGDKVEIRDRQVYINGEQQKNPSKVQFGYSVQTPGVALNPKQLDEWGVSNEDINGGRGIRNNQNMLVLNQDQVELIKGTGSDVKIDHIPQQPMPRVLFPQDPKNFPNWTVDNFGPVDVPAAGQKVQLTPANIALYKRIIEVYEGPHKVIVKNGKVFIDGQETSDYTFSMNYYWVMGDNRHNSEDSRFWGFVPQDHIVGKPLFIWFSTKGGNLFNGIRWNRLFSSATKM